jgi:polar amino acid transport system permease protein
MRNFELPELFFLLRATEWTVVLSLIAFAVGGLGGGAIALLRVGRRRALRLAALGFIQLFQGTPLLMQL